MGQTIKGLTNIASNLSMTKKFVLDLILILDLPVKKVGNDYTASTTKLGQWIEAEWTTNNFIELDQDTVEKLSKKTKKQLRESNIFIFLVGEKRYVSNRKYDKYQKIVEPVAKNS
jgi:hypothetical protein